jgi:hypothetical protein
MKINKAIIAAFSLLLSCSYASADVIYENGTFNGTFQGAQISPPQAITDSFTVTDAATLNLVTVGLWAPVNSVPQSLDWSVGTTQFGSEAGSGTATLFNTFVRQVGDFDVYLSTFALYVPLAAGDYWLTLDNGSNVGGGMLGWDINFGPSAAFYAFPGETGPAASEYFRLEGTLTPPSNVPEPATLAIFAGGLMGLAFVRRTRNR